MVVPQVGSQSWKSDSPGIRRYALIGADGQLHAVIVGVHAVALIAVGEIQLVAFAADIHDDFLAVGGHPRPELLVAIAFEGVGARLIIIVKDGVNLIFQIGAALEQSDRPRRARQTGLEALLHPPLACSF